MAWIFQDNRAKKKLGDKAPWSVGWEKPDGKRTSKKIGTKTAAKKYMAKIEGELVTGLYKAFREVSWKQFRKEYEEKILPKLAPSTQEITLHTLKRFEDLGKVSKVSKITTATMDGFIQRRRKAVAAATVNKDLRHIKAVLRIAVDWKYLVEMPRIRFLKEPKHRKPTTTFEDFANLYKACEGMENPSSDNYSAEEWWKALLTFAFMTGWRISQILALKWDDVSLDKGRVFTHAEDNKGKRDMAVRLHPVAVEHLRKIIDFGPMVFPWPYTKRHIWEEFKTIREAAGVDEGAFHALRRGFATANRRLDPGDLQTMMQHKCYSTTQRYIDEADEFDEVVDQLKVPTILRGDSES